MGLRLKLRFAQAAEQEEKNNERFKGLIVVVSSIGSDQCNTRNKRVF